MTIAVTNRIPNDREGAVGEMRLINAGNGLFLYIKGYNHWGYTKLNNTRTLLQTDRNDRKRDQKRIRRVINETHPSNPHGSGVLAGGGNDGGGPRQDAGDDVPH